MDEAKQQIREIVENRLHPGKFGKYGVVRNGILLHGPRGSGKTFLAEATAREFKLEYKYMSSPALLNMWLGETGKNIRNALQRLHLADQLCCLLTRLTHWERPEIRASAQGRGIEVTTISPFR